MKSTPLIAVLTRYASRLRFPTLFAVTAALFVIDMLVPDFIPFADEVLLALATLLLGTWKQQRSNADDPTAGPQADRQSTGSRP